MSREPARPLPNYDDPSWGRAEAHLLYTERPASAGSANVLLVRVTSAEADRRRGVPAVVSVVLDTSGSMEGDTLDAARNGCLLVAQALSSADEISVVDCGTRPRAIFPSRPVADRARLEEAVAKLRASGGADLATALALGLEQVAYRNDGPALRNIVVVSDGPPTGRLRTPDDFGPLLDEAVRASATITAVGVGEEYDVALLGEMARRTGGRLIGVHSPAELEAKLAEIGRRIAETRMGAPSVTVRLLAGNNATRCEEPVVARILAPLVAGEAREVVLDLTHEARQAGVYVVAEVLVEALDALQGTMGSTTLTTLARFDDGSSERPDPVVASARRALDHARAIASAGGTIRSGKRAPVDGLADLEGLATSLHALGRPETAGDVREVLAGLRSGRVADANKALAPIVLDIAIGRSAPPGVQAAQQSGTDATGETETAAT